MAQEVVDTRNDPYAAYGARTANDGIFLTFSKGEYLYGKAKDELSVGTRLVANMPGLRSGWKCWKDGQVVHDRTHLVSEGRTEEDRSDLGDHDPDMWEKDDKGEPRDPWVLTSTLEMADPKAEKLYMFGTSSAGGRRAIGKLCKDYARGYRMRPGMLPVIELDRDSYMHKNPRFGKIYNPVFRIVDWVNERQLSLIDYHEPGEDEQFPESQYIDRNGEVALKPGGTSVGDIRPYVSREPGEDDDDIPFSAPAPRPSSPRF